ncbi:UNVERIFIED_CONTAM: hypothetical protein FKN15_077247 [Acipenser sinensis]
MSVKFSDDMGELEEAVDLGGPRREFLRLLMHSLEQSPIFEGVEGVKKLALSSKEGNTESILECILAFATGSSTVPPVGFCPEPSLEFLPPQDVAAEFPIANTCVNWLRLPLLENYDNFKTNRDFAICNTQGFGIE